MTTALDVLGRAARGDETTSTVSRVFLDTNVLAYQFDSGEPAKQDRARRIVARADHEFVISTQVLLELFVVITRKLDPALPHGPAARVIEQLSTLPVVTTDAELVRRAAATADRHQLSVWDSLIIEAAADAGCTELWTEDLASGSVLRGVTIINPFLDTHP